MSQTAKRVPYDAIVSCCSPPVMHNEAIEREGAFSLCAKRWIAVRLLCQSTTTDRRLHHYRSIPRTYTASSADHYCYMRSSCVCRRCLSRGTMRKRTPPIFHGVHMLYQKILIFRADDIEWRSRILYLYIARP